MKVSVLSANASLDALVDLIDVGGTGNLYIRTGAAPTNTTDADSGTLLATCPMSATAFGAAGSNIVTAAAISSDTSIDATDTAAHFRIKSGGGTVIIQGTVGTAASDINFNSVGFVTGGTCAISSMVITQPLT